MKQPEEIKILYKDYELKYGNTVRPALFRALKAYKPDNHTILYYNIYIDDKVINKSCEYNGDTGDELPKPAIYMMHFQEEYYVDDRSGEEILCSNLVGYIFDDESVEDWSSVFWDYIQMYHLNQPLPFALLANVLNLYRIRRNAINNAIKSLSLPQQEIDLILGQIQNTSWVLAQNKIDYSNTLLASYNLPADIKFQDELIQAAETLDIPSPYTYNALDLADLIIDALKKTQNISKDTNSFIGLLSALRSGDFISDDCFAMYFPFLNDEYQALAIRKYFAQVKDGYSAYSENTRSIFLSQNYEYFQVYRHLFNNWPKERQISTELLFDCIETYSKTDQKSFQVFNGLLNWAVEQSTNRRSLINFNFREWLPSCTSGTLVNEQFKGFAEFYITYEFDELFFEEERLNHIIPILLNKAARRRYHTVEEEIINPKTEERSIETKIVYEDIWDIYHETDENGVITRDYKPLADLFVNWDINDNFEVKPGIQSFSKKMIDPSIVYDRVISYSQKYYNTDEPTLPYRRQEFVIKLFGSPITMSAAIYEDTTLGALSDKFDIINIRKNVETLLQNLFGESLSCDYDISKLNHALTISLYKNEEDMSNDCFIKKQAKVYPHDFARYCSPKISEVSHPLTGKKYCVCDKDMCFQTCLQKDVNWWEYKLLHILEILGYNILESTDAGYITNRSYNSFIAQVNKVIRFYKRLKCKECGYLLFPTSIKSPSSHATTFSCQNPLCSEQHKIIYLNYCYNCKKGIIDSRETQRCPNERYICPTCNSCCSNESFDKIVQDYIRQGRSIPSKISSKLGKGHQDLHQYFCHKCGAEMVLKEGCNSPEAKNFFCPNCESKHLDMQNPTEE